MSIGKGIAIAGIWLGTGIATSFGAPPAVIFATALAATVVVMWFD